MMQGSPELDIYYKARAYEVVESGLGMEREEFLHRQVNRIAHLQFELQTSQRQNHEMEAAVAGHATRETNLEAQLAALKRHAASVEVVCLPL
jgi:hypothetical protein